MVVMLTFIIIIGLLNLLPGQTNGKEIISFDNGGGQPSVEIELFGDTGVSSDSTTYFSIPIHKGKIQEASFKITCMPNIYGSSLSNPRLDVGIDGDFEWRYEGRGYGAIGHQETFTTGFNRKMIAIGNKLTNTGTNIYLPESAFVTDAEMEIVGGNLKYGEIYIAVVTNNGNIYYIKSNKDKTFGPPQLVGSVGSNSYGIGMGDFDDDGDYDIIVNQGWWSSTVGNIYLFRQDGKTYNNFTQLSKPIGYTTTGRNTDFAVGDFDNDKKLDFIESEMGSNFFFFKGHGNNSFTRTQILSSFSGGTPYEKDVADFDLDGNLDMVVGGTNPKNVYIYMGNGDGTFNKQPISVTSYTGTATWTWGSESVIAGDFNQDGSADLIASEVNWEDNIYRYMKGNVDLNFKAPQDLSIPSDSWNPRAATFDFNLDGYLDIVTYDNSPSSGTVKVYWGSGNGNFNINPLEIGSIGWGIEGITAPPTVILGGCDNLKVDVGRDGGEEDFSFTGPISKKEQIPDAEHPNKFKNVLNGILSDPPETLRRVTDEYGNTLLEIPIKFSADEMGYVLLQNLSIRYTYTAQVDINPNNGNLVNELNDLIPSDGQGEFRVYFCLKSDTPGKAKFSDLYIKFNEAPITKTIPDFTIDEGTDHPNLANLALYFNDDEELPEELRYSIISYSNSDKIKVNIKNDHLLSVNATKDPDWSGEIRIIVAAKDLGKGITTSNEFMVRVNPVNDPPRVGNKIGNIEMLPNSISEKIDLDTKENKYFYDIDSSNMYFKAVIFDKDNSGKYDGYLQLPIDNDTNILYIHSLDQPRNRIPVRIYCSDDVGIRTMNLTQLTNNIPTYQHIIVNITKIGFGEKPTYPPVWKEIEDIIIPEDESKLDWINLNDYITDLDDPTEELFYTVESVSNSAYINVFIASSKDKTKNILNIIPEPNYAGEALVTLRVEDDDHNYAFERFTIKISPKPDIPEINIVSPSRNAIVSGLVTISGTAYDAEDELERIEIKVGASEWQTAEGLEYWHILWDSTELTTSVGKIEIRARAMDKDNSYSIYDSVILEVRNSNVDNDNDDIPDIYDACPNDPLNWVDSDGDGLGDNTDQFPFDPTQWQDIDGDGYGDNPSGIDYDQFPFDPTQWQDFDGDGYGDNPDGNNPDNDPNKPFQSEDDEKDTETRIYTAENAPWLALGILIIIDILIFGYFIINRKKIKEKKESEK
jgi:hypothetical protein